VNEPTQMRAMPLEVEIGRLLTARGWRIALAETSTGGLIGYLLTTVPGSSAYFDCSIVAYSNHAKETALGISGDILKRYGAVSLEVAFAMATNLQRRSQVQVGLAVSGLTGPRTGRRSQKPIGLTYVVLSLPHVTLWWEGILPGERTEIQRQSALRAPEMLREGLLQPTRDWIS
jgi:nicotinamide-nucleotide amidase